MSAQRSVTLPAVPIVPPLPWWIMLGAVLAAFLLVNWIAGAVVLGLLLIQRARPLDFLTSYLMVVSVGSIINYGSGKLTREMWVLTAFLVFMLMCYGISRRWDMFVFPRSPVMRPLLIYLGLTFINFIRGMVVGNSARYAGLELVAALALGSCLLVASRRITEGEMKGTLTWLWLLGLSHAALGFYIFSIVKMRTGSIYFMPVTGMFAMILWNFALREKRLFQRALWVTAMMPLLLHQFLSFTRGYWFGVMAGILFSVVVYGWRGTGARERWRSAGAAIGVLIGFGIMGIALLGAVLGIAQVGELAANRLASSTGTEYTWEATSNVVRLVEYVRVAEDIIERPLFGWGLGHFFVVREPINFALLEQWWVHEMYLYVLLKQGLLGLGLWLWLMWSFIRMGISGRDLPTTWEQAMSVGAAAITVYCCVFGLVHFPLAEVNATFTFALANGVAMRLTSKDTVALRWKQRRTQSGGA